MANCPTIVLISENKSENRCGNMNITVCALSVKYTDTKNPPPCNQVCGTTAESYEPGKWETVKCENIIESSIVLFKSNQTQTQTCKVKILEQQQGMHIAIVKLLQQIYMQVSLSS